ncbi:MAG: hypothetical protein EOO40_04205, partial [Deltaproteobacteria bacterium]
MADMRAVVALLAAVLLLGSCKRQPQLLRQAPVPRAMYPQAAEPLGEVRTYAAAERRRGAAAYSAACAICHQDNARGVRDAIAPLYNHAANLSRLPGGRSYLIDVVLCGVAGPIRVADVDYNNLMPAVGARLDDATVAQLLNFVTQVLCDPPTTPSLFAAEHIAARRARPCAIEQVRLRRPDSPRHS